VTRTIQFILAPVVMVSTCSMLLGNLLSRYAVINNRLRSLAQEHRTLTRTDVPTTMGATPDAPAARAALRLQEIDAQLPSLLRRHRLMRRSVLIVNHAILVFFADMLVIALASLEATVGWATGLALLCFLVGIALAAVGLFLSTQEVRTSHLAVLHDVSWFVGTVGAQSRAGTRCQADTSPPPGTCQYNRPFGREIGATTGRSPSAGDP
jgi:hypothetical protein